MYRYFALIWNSADPRATASAARLHSRLLAGAAEWETVVRTTGLIALQSGASGANGVCRLDAGDGAVLGRVFSRDDEGGCAAVSTVRIANARTSSEANPNTKECAKSLFENYWGRYVALIRASLSGAVRLARDPSGALPCFLIRHEDVHLVFSDLADCLPLGPRFSINWDYVRRFVAYSALHTTATGLKEVSEVLPGEIIEFRGDALMRSLEWSPVEIARANPIEQPQQAIAALRHTVRACVWAWASAYPAIVHRLSGGLDSSIVAACLSDAPSRPRVTCLNCFSHGRNEDERHYARLMAARVELPLIEHEIEIDFRLQDILNIRPAANPWFYAYELQHGRYEARLAAERDAAAVFSGAGGDGVFYQARADLAVTDYLWAHGLSPGLFGVALDAARVSRSSMWPLLRRALRARLKDKPWHPTSALAETGLERTLIARSILDAAVDDEALLHPSLRGAHRFPPGLAWHITTVAVPVSYYSGFERDGVPERIMPLTSQPLVELCLRIPTYVWITGGRDRSLVRSAFEQDLPREIVRRRAKGVADASLRNVLDANLPFVRELLLDGWMVKEGLLDRARLEVYLSRQKSPADGEYNEILQNHLSTEAWLRSWKALEQRAVA